jgi:mannose-6-phosphate isomerase-like protein (cupin superfamily)
MHITKKKSDHAEKMSDTCGVISEVLRKGEYLGLDLAIVNDINTTVGHYHKSFDEIYVITGGFLSVEFYNPVENVRWNEEFQTDELCVISKGLHHKVIDGSPKNKLMVICVPGFDIADEHRSDVLEGRSK